MRAVRELLHHRRPAPATGKTRYVLHNRPFVPDHSVYLAPLTLPEDVATCAAGVACVRVLDGNDHGATYLTTGGPTGDDRVRTVRYDRIRYADVPSGTRGGRLVDVGDGYAVVDEPATNRQVVVNLSLRRTVRTGTIGAAAVWHDTMWTGGPGGLTGTNLTTGATRTLSTGSTCTPSEVRTGARGIWWACGTTGPAGVSSR